MDVFSSAVLRRTVGYPDGELPQSKLTEAVAITLAAHHTDIHIEGAGILDIAKDLLANYKEKMRLLSGVLPPVSQRIQNFLDSHLRDVIDQAPNGVNLPDDFLVLPCHGLARALSLPGDKDTIQTEYVTSYKLMQGVLHNPRSDKRTTQGSFHIAEGGLDIAADKYRVPKATFAKILSAALNPPDSDLLIPFTAGTGFETKVMVSLLLRPTVSPVVPGVYPAKQMEVYCLAPGSLVSNLDFLESVFGNAGDPYLPENDASLDVEHFTGTTGFLLLAPHVCKLTKKSLGLPHFDQATPLQKEQGMCWKSEDEKYNDGRPFKITCRTMDGVIVTIIADNYFGYCKKEVKSQISYSANLSGLYEEEHSGGTVAFPRFSFGMEVDCLSEMKRWPHLEGHTFEKSLSLLGDSIIFNPEKGFAVDKQYPETIFYIPEDSHFSLNTNKVTWTYKEKNFEMKISPAVCYILPSGYRIHMEKHIKTSMWRLIGTDSRGTNLHKPCTVSGGGKSELSKSISGNMMFSPLFINNPQQDFDMVNTILNYDKYSSRFREARPVEDTRPILSPHRPLGSVINMLTPSLDYTDAYNQWLRSFPPHIMPIVFYVKRFYKTAWNGNWRDHFSMDLINGESGHELKFDNRLIMASFLRVGFTPANVWRTYKMRTDYIPTAKLQTEDDISASITVPTKHVPQFQPYRNRPSYKLTINCEFRLFQRPDDCIYRGMDEQCEWDLSQPGNFIANFEPLTAADARNIVTDVSDFEHFTEPMKETVMKATKLTDREYFVCSSNTRIVNGKPTANPRYLQVRPDATDLRETYIYGVAQRMLRGIAPNQELAVPIDLMLIGRRISKPAPGLPNLAVYNPIHYQELPEFLMDVICGMSGSSPSTTGAGSEGALTKGPFNAVTFTADVTNLMVSCILTGLGGWSTPTGYIGPTIPFAHDSSVLTPEVLCRMQPHEREPAFLIQNGYLEKVKDFEYKGKLVQASRLGYRITQRFSHFFALIFDFPNIFDDKILKPELQDMDSFVEGIEELITAQKVISKRYFDDGTVNLACPPLKALLNIMMHGDYEGKTLNDPAIREMFTLENMLASDWYKQRIARQQRRDVAHWEKSLAYIEKYMKEPRNASIVRRLGLNEKKEYLQAMLTKAKSPEYLNTLVGTIGADPIIKE
eukprot:TRINITY_DN17_c0_g1_i2.p1 TRINITY_DN17_c0_g1~~TRINITY_DN17_c0_g1_i2.p1  ORF type:complete len:1157 (+),score=318.39 TRINITY_DN17_c0_g1_i2:42-3512(+)